MTQRDVEEKQLIAKYYGDRLVGGIFSNKTRRRLLGTLGLSGRYRTENDFYYDVRNYVKTALCDLRVFIEKAGRGNVNQVLTREALKPVVEALLLSPIVHKSDPDLARAEIAQMFIQAGFEYLEQMQKEHVTGLYKRAVDDGLQACNYLVELFKQYGERRLISALDLPCK